MDNQQETKEKTRIVWMMDETIAESHPRDWNRLRQLYTELLTLVGKEQFQHVVADPIPAFTTLAKRFSEQGSPSFIIDLSGWSSAFLQAAFPGTEVYSGFGMSRVRDISSPELHTTGHLLKTSQQTIEGIKRTKDLSDVLLFDDTTVTGGTGIKTTQLFGLDKVTHAYLIANTGDSPQLEGAVKRIRKLGHDVVYGSEIDFPREDGWHLKDLHQLPDLTTAFYTAMRLQELFLDKEKHKEKITTFLKDEKNLETLFPQRYSSGEIRNLHSKGKFLLSNGALPTNGTIHAVNPVLWASKYLMDHVDAEKVLTHRDEVHAILGELKHLTKNYGRVREEVDKELTQIAQQYR